MIEQTASHPGSPQARLLELATVQYNAMFYATPAQFKAFSRNAVFANMLLMFVIAVIASEFYAVAPMSLTVIFPLVMATLMVIRIIHWYRHMSEDLSAREILKRTRYSAYLTAGVGMMLMVWAFFLAGYFEPYDNFAPNEPKVLLISSIGALVIAILLSPVWGITAMVGTAFILPLCVHMALSGWVMYMISSVLLAAGGLAITFIGMQLSARYREIHYLQSLIKAQNLR